MLLAVENRTDVAIENGTHRARDRGPDPAAGGVHVVSGYTRVSTRRGRRDDRERAADASAALPRGGADEGGHRPSGWREPEHGPWVDRDRAAEPGRGRRGSQVWAAVSYSDEMFGRRERDRRLPSAPSAVDRGLREDDPHHRPHVSSIWNGAGLQRRAATLKVSHFRRPLTLRAPHPDPPLQRPPNPPIQLRMGSHQLLKHRDRPKPRTRLQQRNHLRLEHPRQRVRSATTPPLPLRAPLLQHPVPTRPAEPGPRRSHRDRTPLSLRHEDPPLLIGDVTARHRSPPAGGRASADPDLDPRGNPGSRASAPPDRLRLQRRSHHLPTPDERPTPSHPVCRARLTQIDEPQFWCGEPRPESVVVRTTPEPSSNGEHPRSYTYAILDGWKTWTSLYDGLALGSCSYR